MSTKHRFGMVALAGPPNVGKSTLLNALIGKKISIMSRRPQTTRHRILGIKSTADFQIVFIDTPGLHTTHNKPLNRAINRTAVNSLFGVDLILFMLDYRGWSDSIEHDFRHCQAIDVPIILLINKIDKLQDKTKLLPLIESSRKLHAFQEIIPISALRERDTAALVPTIVDYLPYADAGFPTDQVTDKSERFMAAELIREQLFESLGHELPYAIAVEITQLRDRDPDLNSERDKKNSKNNSKNNSRKKQVIRDIEAIIWVETNGQKVIVIGKQGQQLKVAATKARRQMEKILAKKVFLTVWVKVKKDWTRQTDLIQRLGVGEHHRC